jgi:predicted AAA+ superfamily ATPase
LLTTAAEVTVDEAQKLPALFDAIKVLVDQDRRPGRFLLSGSANFLLLKRLSESLAGRAIHLHLGPLTWAECRKVDRPALVRLLAGDPPDGVFGGSASSRPSANPAESDWLAGGFPNAVLETDEAARQLWFTGYEQTYLDRDLRDLSQVGDLGLFRRFLRLMALRTAQVLNRNDLARDCGTNAVTTARWLSLLETSFIVRVVPPYFNSRIKRLAKAPKAYMADSGLAAFLCGLHSATHLAGHALRGSLAETYVCQNLAAILDAYAPDARLMHYRTHAGLEVDFVVEAGQTVLALEVKASSRVDRRDLKGVSAFLDVEPRCALAMVLYTGTVAEPIGPRTWLVPIGVALG